VTVVELALIDSLAAVCALAELGQQPSSVSKETNRATMALDFMTFLLVERIPCVAG
jgi:hypothetical protein